MSVRQMDSWYAECDGPHCFAAVGILGGLTEIELFSKLKEAGWQIDGFYAGRVYCPRHADKEKD